MATDSVPVVDPVDLQRVYEVSRELSASRPQSLIGAGLLAQFCKPGADMEAINQRLIVLKIFAKVPDLAPWLKDDGSWSPPVFRMAAKFPMKWLQRGTFPLDVKEFLKQIRAEEQEATNT